MNAISLWEPWASLMMLGAKTIETRSWATKYRGPLLICAAQRGLSREKLWRQSYTRGVFRAALTPITNNNRIFLGKFNFYFGYALCAVDLVDCLPTESAEIRRIIDAYENEYQFGNYEPGRFAWITRDARPLRTPVRVTGRQRLFSVPDDVIASAMREPEGGDPWWRRAE